MNIEYDYLKLLKDVLDNGKEKGDRTGTGTISVFGRQIRHKMSEGFPLLTTKKMYWKGIVTELLWFLRGDTNIKWLVNNNNNIWVGDAYKNFSKHDWYDTGLAGLTKEGFVERIKTNDGFAEKWGELGPIYGKQWRKLDKWVDSFDDGRWVVVDQIQNLINELKTNPDSRRLMVSAWNVGELDQMTLPPCHYGFQVYTRELKIQERMDWLNKKNNTDERYRTSTLDGLNAPARAISLMWNQRSVDTFLGLPFNIASYGLLLEIIAKEVNMVPDELIGNLGDVHLYKNHIEQAKEQLTREPKRLPTLEIIEREEQNFSMDEMYIDNFQFPNYQSHPSIKAPLSN